ncbi:hypothetical protein HOE41_02805 [Candidatus Woesearchaeota archaeon]|nr:hypothetical protein [Candidatus Woesearchaeota archaeon]
MSRKFSFVTERKIQYLENSLARLQARRTEVVDRLDWLNTAYSENIVDYEHYIMQRSVLLNGKTVDSWDADWIARRTQIEETLHALHYGRATADVTRAAKKAFGIAAVFIMILAALAGMQAQVPITGFAGDSSGFVAEANITAYFAVAASENLADGIEFSTIVAGTNNNNASDNYNNDSSGSSMYLSVSNDSNVPIDFCLAADQKMKSGTDAIELANFVWNSSTSTDASTPTLASATAMTTSFVSADTAVTGGLSEYLRFWLSVPLGQTAGTYNNTVTLRAVQNGQSCS